MTDILVMVAPLLVAILWVIQQERSIRKANKKLAGIERQLIQTKDTNNLLMRDNEYLKSILLDVAYGELHVWIEDDELRATRLPAGEVPIH